MAPIAKSIMPSPTPANPIEKFVKALLARLGQHMREKAHVRVIITIRDGKIVLVNEDRTYLPDNFPET